MKTKLPNRILSLLLCVAMLSAMILPSRPEQVHAADETYEWNNGSIVDYVHYTGEKNYLDDAPFGYAYFYQGTDPSDARAAGFYDMILAVNGGDNWFKNRYYCGATDGETTYNNRTAAIHMAAVTYPTYHYSTGYVFTAPYTGTVEFTYQYAAANTSAAGMPFYVMGENATSYGDALKKLTTTKTVSVTDKTASSYDEVTFTVDMTAGEKLYFVADSDASSKAFGHWISSVRYLPDTNDTWTNGNIVDYVHYTGEKNYLDDSSFSYAYYYQGTNPSDSRTAGFYDMILAVNGGNNWFKNRYYCGATDAETEYNARTAAVHLAAVTYPTYHYSTGYVFTAPQSGKVAFTYQYAAVNQSAVGMPFYVMRESATGYGDALQKFTAAKLANVNDKAASQYDEATFTVDVTAGEKIYFVADSDASNKAFGHWISAVRYLPTTTSVTTDQPSYKQGSSITVTASLSNGSFGANDYIAIIPEGQTEPAVKKPAAASVTFTDTLPVGKYQVVLVLDCMTEYAASATIEIIENTVTLTHTPLFGVGSGQDGAIYNGKVFYFSANGICKVHDLATGEYLNYFTLDNTSAIIPHANSVCFSNTYYEAGDAYPLLYANVYNNYSTATDRREGTCCVYRLTETDGHFSTELVQIIKIGFTEDLNLWKSEENNADVVPYGNFVVDTDNNDLYVFVMRDADQKTRFFRFPLPALSEGNYSNVYGCNVVTFEETDIESRFDVSYFSYMQGCCYADGKIFSVEGLGPDSGTKPALRVIDLESQSVIHTEMLEDYGLSGEPEMIDAYNGKLYFISTDRCFREMNLAGVELPCGTSVTTDPTWNVGDTITVTATLSSGVFSANDYIAIIPNGESTPVAKKPAAESVVFTDSIPAGQYQVVLVRDGIAGYAATADITVTERSSAIKWNNGNLTSRIGVHGEYLYHDSDSPFDYAFYYEGTDPNDSRSKGFYEMLLGFNGNTNTWCNYRYFCGLRTNEATSNNRTSAIHLAASTAPNYHYSPGMVFTAPHSGTVEFTYQYAGLDSLNDNHTFYVLRESATGYGDALKSYKQSKLVRSAGGGEYSEDVFTLEVTAGEKIYFIVDNSGNGSMSAHWIKSAKYLTVLNAWDNGNILDKTYWKGEKQYLDDAPFSYAYWYQGTDPNDSRPAGFSDMILGNTGVNWTNGRYFCSDNAADTASNNRTAAIHLAAVTYPTYHYSTGFAFTAPSTGTVEFTYQYANVGSAKAGHFYVLRESATGYDDALYSFTSSAVAYTDTTEGGTYDESTFSIEVTKGERIYFIVDTDLGSGAYTHWISSVTYPDAAQLSAPDSVVYDRTATAVGMADGKLTITNTAVFPPESYVAYWADANGPLKDYTAFTSIVYAGETTTYNLPSGSMIPAEADRILVYAQSGSVVSKQATAAMLPAGCNDYDFGAPLYEMQVVSDVHINAASPGKHSEHFSALLEQVKAISPNSIGLFINGDTADNGKLADWELFHSLIANAGDGLPAIYNAIGNHDLYSGDYTLFVEQTQPCTDKPYTDFWLKGTHFIFLGSEINDLNAQLSDQQLAWLEETLAKDRDLSRPIYLFLHQGLSNTVAGTEPTSGYHSVAQNDAVCEILKDYPEVILFSSHSHRDMNVAPAYVKRSENLPAILNTAAVAYLRPDNDAYNADGSQAYFIYAYSDKLVVMGRDVVSNKWLASSTFCIDLSNVTVPTRTEIHSNKAMYAQGEEITVTATLKSGVFGTNDYVAILAKGESTPIAKQAAAPALSFADALSPGEYLLVLKLDGQEGYAAQTVIRVAEAPTADESSWDNGNLTSHLGSGAASFYGEDTPFSYAFFYEGTDPTDNREKGFHDMVLADNGVAWSDGRWFCGLTSSESANINRVNTIHTAASVAPSWHYSPGVCFTAPYTGTVQFIYQIAHLDTFANQHQIYVMREDAENYTDALKAYKPTATSIVSSSDGSGTYDTIRLTVDVTKGEKLYFIVDNRNNGSMTAHWIKSAQYLTVSDTVYSVYTDKESYNVGDSITAYAAVSDGVFDANDYIAILAEGTSAPIAKKAAVACVTFTQELSAGTYQVVLVADGAVVAAQKIRVMEKVSAADGTWNNGNINSRVGAYGEYLYYDADSPFGYAFFYEGTDPEDTRPAGFHDMILASNGGVNTWCDNRYFCGLNGAETANINRVLAIHLAAANAPNYHYSPGVVFTAPYSGTVEFTYQYAGLDALSDNHTFYVMRESASGYGDAIKSFKQSKIIYTGGSGQYSEDTFTVEVTAGEKIYFVVDNVANGDMSAHWIKSAKYLIGGASCTLSADKELYSEGEKITVAATISAGTFGEDDYIAILADGKTEPALKLPAAQSVVFEPTAQQLPGGKYQIMLVLDGEDAYVDGKANCVASTQILIRDTIDPDKSAWNYGTLLTRLGAAGEKKYYSAKSPFGYAFFYEGTDPEDTREKGFYSMIRAKNSGKNTWCNNRYFCGLNASEYANINRTAAIHLAASNAPNYHYSPGMVFTAPYTGTVKICYQFAGLDAIDGNHTFYVMRESAEGYSDALYAFKATKTVYSNGTGRTYNEEIFTINVAAGEKIYFVVDNAANGSMSAHWISTVQYLNAAGEPLGSLPSPNTGDSANIAVWLSVLMLSALGICALAVLNVKGRKKAF